MLRDRLRRDGAMRARACRCAHRQLVRPCIPRRWKNHCGIDAAFIHQGDCLFGTEFCHLAMGKVAPHASSPNMNLRVDNVHLILFSTSAKR
ncbi:uncharacterized protein METZ01_LOCUS486854 [marine metagenome]|uniref:Uncharacterized protein n=1 Tax=marine metagenome TaxID=408172 RepID=A0A383CPP6_9ZZZZ